MSRTPPPLTPDQQRDSDRIAALKIGTPEAIRDWAARYRVPLINPEDDEALLLSIHQARLVAFVGPLRAASRAWLAANESRIRAERTPA